MADPDRSERPLKLDPGVEAALVQLIATERWVAHPDEPDSTTIPKDDRAVSLDALAGCESAVDAQLTDEAVALLSSETETLSEGLQMTLGMVGTHTELAHDRGMPSTLVAIGRRGRTFYAVPKRPETEDRARLWVFDGHKDPWRIETARLLIQLAEERADELEMDEATQAEIESELNIAHYLPRLARPEAAVEAPAERRVRHPKFGEGTVLQELHDGPEPKLVVRFDQGAEKTLLARFLEDA
ncbi:MAG TPA: hypothetical protein RMH99_20230 [Sandaracinaceae bacterium LLY-WYZ-13_1]|nr:hypothetical protein [Sandaracinaceae bacterium LLY-WYZ-13_1]